MARPPERNASTPAGQEPSALDPVGTAMQALQGSVRLAGEAGPSEIRVRAVGEEPEDLRALLQGIRDARQGVSPLTRWSRRPRGRGRGVDAVRRCAWLEQAGA